MRRYLTPLLCISFTCYTLYAHTDCCVDTCESICDNYSWELSDKNMKKVATGMVSWGIFMAAFTLFFTGFIPNDPGTTTTTDSSSSGNNPLF